MRIAETKINMARAEAEKMRTKSVLLDEMKFIMGIPFVERLNCPSRTLPPGGRLQPGRRHRRKTQKAFFCPAYPRIRRRSKKKNIALSLHPFPASPFSFGFTSAIVHPQQHQLQGRHFHVAVHVSQPDAQFPFDWWTKGRDVSRQYKKMTQLSVEGRNQEFT